MLIRQDNPTGPHRLIDQLQQELQSALFAAWGLDETLDADLASFLFYPACYRNKTPAPGSGYIAEIYQGQGEYREAYFDDTLKGLCFFGLGSKEGHGLQNTLDVHLVAFINLQELYPQIAHRADYEARREFEKVLASPLFGFELISIETGLANVLREYPGSYRDGRLDLADMGLVHAFRLNLSLTYTPTDC